MFGPRLRQAQRIATRRYAQQVAPYLLWYGHLLPYGFNPYQRQRAPTMMGNSLWAPHPVGFYRKYNGAHGQWCCSNYEFRYKRKGWRRARGEFLRGLDPYFNR